MVKIVKSEFLDYCKSHGAQQNKTVIIQEQMGHYWYISWDIISDANSFGGTYDEEEAYEALSRFMIWQKASNWTEIFVVK